jgi:hypothetical protein
MVAVVPVATTADHSSAFAEVPSRCRFTSDAETPPIETLDTVCESLTIPTITTRPAAAVPIACDVKSKDVPDDVLVAVET